MKKIIRITESDLTRIIRRVINEQSNYDFEEVPSDVCAELPDQELQKMESELRNILPGTTVDGLGGDIVGSVINKLNATPEQKKELRPQLIQFVESLKGLKLKDLINKLSRFKQKLKYSSLKEQSMSSQLKDGAKDPKIALFYIAMVAILIAWIVQQVKDARTYRKEKKKRGKDVKCGDGNKF